MPKSTNLAEPQQRLREGDNGVGIPPSAGTDNARPLTEAEVAEHKRQEDDEQRERLRERLRQFEAGATFQLPPGLVRIAVSTSLLLAAVLALLLVTQVASLIVDIETMSPPWNWILGSLGALFAVILIWVASKLALSLLRLRRSPSVNLAAIRALQERSTWRRLATDHADQAEDKLRAYLNEYNLDAKFRNTLTASGLGPDEFDRLSHARQYLLSDELPLPTSEWLDAFACRFQSVLDRAAERQAKSYFIRTAVGTAVSPLPVLDQAVVLYSSLKLISHLLVLYNVRPALGQTVTVLARAIVQTYLGSQAQRVTEAVAETAWREIVGPPEELFGSIATKAAAKFTEGIANGYLVWRLGRRAAMLLQPVTRSDSFSVISTTT